MQIAIIIGSVREGRYTDKVAHFLHDQLALKPEVHPHIWDLAQDEVPILTNRWAKQEDPHENLPLMSQFLKTADGIILCSPEYHGSYSGVLKNAIDHFWKEFYRKPMGVVATGSGRFGGINASSEMQQLILSLGAFPMPTKLLVPYIQDIFGPENVPLEASFVRQVDHFVNEFLWFAQVFAAARKHA